MSGLAGRLDPSRFGFAMPVTDPPFDHPPYYYRGIEVMGFAYETEDEAAADIVPEGLTIADSPAIAQVIFTNFHFSTLGAYTEAILGLSCLWEGELVTYCSNLLVTNEIGLIGVGSRMGSPSCSGTWCGPRSTRSSAPTPSAPEASAFAPGCCGPGTS